MHGQTLDNRGTITRQLKEKHMDSNWQVNEQDMARFAEWLITSEKDIKKVREVVNKALGKV